jgi:hypothetical protein
MAIASHQACVDKSSCAGRQGALQRARAARGTAGGLAVNASKTVPRPAETGAIPDLVLFNLIHNSLKEARSKRLRLQRAAVVHGTTLITSCSQRLEKRSSVHQCTSNTAP